MTCIRPRNTMKLKGIKKIFIMRWLSFRNINFQELLNVKRVLQHSQFRNSHLKFFLAQMDLSMRFWQNCWIGNLLLVKFHRFNVAGLTTEILVKYTTYDQKAFVSFPQPSAMEHFFQMNVFAYFFSKHIRYNATNAEH